MLIYKRNLLINYSSRFLANMLFTMPIWVAYFNGFLSSSELSIIISIQYLVQIILEIPSGAIADLLGRKTTIALGYLIGSIGTFGVIIATTFWHFLVMRIMFAIMDAFISGADEALIYDSLKQDNVEGNYRKIYSKSLIAAQLGIVLAAFSGGFLYSIDFRIPFILCGLGLVIAFVLSLFYKEPDIDSEIFSWNSYKKQFKTGIKEIFKTPMVTQVTLFFIAVGGITWSSQMYFNTSFLTELVGNDTTRGMIQASIRFINILLLATVFGKYDKSTTKGKLLFFPLIMLFAYLPGILIKDQLGVVLVYSATLASTVRWIYLSSITNKLFDSKYRATAISTMSMLVNLVSVLLLFTSGLIIPIGGTGLMFTVLGLMTLLFVFPLYWKVKSHITELA